MDWVKLLRKLARPPAWVIGLLSVVSGVLLTAVFLKGWEQSVAAYMVYVLSFYTLTVACIFLSKTLPRQLLRIRAAVYNNPLGNRYLTDRGFRARLSLQLALGVNLLYVGLHLIGWYLQRSWWFMVLAVYYGILAVMRFLLVRYVHTHTLGTGSAGEWKRARVCGGILLLVNLSLSGAVLMILYQNKGYHYGGVWIYAMAAYTFYSVIHAIVELVRHRSLGSPVMSAAKVVSLCAALVSLLNLETAMFDQFGTDMAPGDQRLMIALTGAGVSVAVVTMAAMLMAKATKEIRRKNHGE